MLEEGRVLLGCRSELLQLRVHALLDFASGVEAAQEHRLTGALAPVKSCGPRASQQANLGM